MMCCYEMEFRGLLPAWYIKIAGKYSSYRPHLYNNKRGAAARVLPSLRDCRVLSGFTSFFLPLLCERALGVELSRGEAITFCLVAR